MSGSPVTTTINDNDLMALKLKRHEPVVEGARRATTSSSTGGADGGAVGDDDAGLGLGTATEVADFAEGRGGLVAGSGLSLSGVSTDAATGAVTFTVTNTGPVTWRRATLASVSLATVDDVLVEGAENFTASLEQRGGVSGSPVTTTINDNDLMALKLSGNELGRRGRHGELRRQKARRGGADGGAVGDDDAGLGPGTATEVADFAAGRGRLVAGSGLSLSGVSTDAATGR